MAAMKKAMKAVQTMKAMKKAAAMASMKKAAAMKVKKAAAMKAMENVDMSSDESDCEDWKPRPSMTASQKAAALAAMQKDRKALKSMKAMTAMQKAASSKDAVAVMKKAASMKAMKMNEVPQMKRAEIGAKYRRYHGPLSDYVGPLGGKWQGALWAEWRCVG